MKIEQEPIKFQDFQLTPNNQGGVLSVIATRKSYQLSQVQFSYISALRVTPTIVGLVEFYLGQGWLVRFSELYNLIMFLLDENIILNTNFHNYFRPAQIEKKFSSNLNTQSYKLENLNISAENLPFFRSLEPSLAKFLLEKSSVLEVPEKFRVTETGSRDRDLYILLQGQAAIFHSLGPTQRQRVAMLEQGAIFGEKAFLLNHPRSADIITTKKSRLLRVPYRTELDSMIKTNAAQSLQIRFWTLQALAGSPVFKNLPSDCIDQLIFSGRVVKTSVHQVLFYEGQPGNTCYIIIQGNVVVSQKQKNVNVLGQGSCFGEISLLISSGKRTATVQTQQECLLLEINQHSFYKVLSQNLLLAKELEGLAYQRIVKDQSRAS